MSALLSLLLLGALLPAAPEVDVSIQPEPAEVGLLMSVTVTGKPTVSVRGSPSGARTIAVTMR